MFELRGLIVAGVIAAALLLPSPALVRAEAGGFEIATFSCDATPPMGHPLCGGTVKPVEGVDDPELAKGIILRDARGVYVLCALDWCELRNDAHDLLAAELAAGAGTTAYRVAVQCLHQHDAPIVDPEAQRLLAAAKDAPVHLDPVFLAGVGTRMKAAAAESVKHFRRVTGIGTGKAMAERVASNRRVPGPNGSILVRWSSVKDPVLIAAPEGRIDPWVRTIAFYDGNKPLVNLHYYATHPQSHYGGGRVSWDVPGIAREQLEKETGVFQVYFTGCAGDITMGKYNDGEPARRGELAGRLHDAMRRSVESIERRPMPTGGAPLRWKSVPVSFGARRDDTFAETPMRAMVANPIAPPNARIEAAIGLAWLERVKEGRPVMISRLGIGPVQIVNLPGEPFIEFQLYAQGLRPGDFVAVAGYADGGPGYICTQGAFAEGGYEPGASYVVPESERVLKEGIRKLLAAE